MTSGVNCIVSVPIVSMVDADAKVIVKCACFWLTRGCTSTVNEGSGTGEEVPCATTENWREPMDNVPLKVPVPEGENSSVNPTLLPGAMLAGMAGAPEREKPAPVTVTAGTLTAEIVVCGLLTVNINLLDELLLPAIKLPKLIAVNGCAVKRTPVESVY